MTDGFTIHTTNAHECLPVLRIVGSLQGERRLVAWGSQCAYLTPKCFKFLAKLAVAAAAEPGRWVKREELERGDNQARYLYRLRGELDSQCVNLPELWENNRRGSYRLTLVPERLQVEWQDLLSHDDWDLVAWVKAFAQTGPVERVLVGESPGQSAAA